jgi:hypothetical protein
VSLKEELLKLTPRSTHGEYSKGKCGVVEWLKNQNEELIKDIVETLPDKTISSNSFYNFLRNKYPDLNFGLTTFKRHRNRECGCP